MIFDKHARDHSFVCVLTRPKGMRFAAFSDFIRLGETFYTYVKTGKWDYQPFSHVVMLYKNNYTQNVQAAQASGSYVNCMHWDVMLPKIVAVKAWHLPAMGADDRRAYHTWLEQQFGKKYAKTQVFGTLLAKAKELITGRKHANPFRNGDYLMYCVELVARSVKKAYHADIKIDYESALTSEVPIIMQAVEGARELNAEEIAALNKGGECLFQ